MLFKVSDDWKQQLSPDDEARLNEILKRVSKYRHAYGNAQDVKVAQLWVALLEMRKENQVLMNRLKKMEFVFGGITERVKKQEESDKELLESLDKF